MVELNPVEARVLGCLIEKEITTPEYYPLSLNALLNACNQKSSRDPVMELAEREVRGALSSLEDVGLVRVLADGRVSKFEHRVRDGLSPTPGTHLRRDEVAVLCLLLLRGPQTAAELRSRAERLYTFGDPGDVLATLERLAARDEPMTKMLPRQPGARELRWRQLLTGAPQEVDSPEVRTGHAGADIRQDSQKPGTTERSPTEPSLREQTLREQVVALEERVRRLEELLEQLTG